MHVTMYINTFIHKRKWKRKLLAEKEKNIKGFGKSETGVRAAEI